MRWLGVFACCVLLAGSNSQETRAANAGEEVTFSVFAFGQTVASCQLTTPTGETLDFIHDQPSQHDSRYELQALSPLLPSCSMAVRDLVVSDSGTWKVAYINTDGGSDSASFDLTVSPVDVEAGLDADVKWLNIIEYPTRLDQNIDISLSKVDYPEECYVRRELGESKETEEFHIPEAGSIEGVTAHNSSDFVSCRITIGPMDASLLGDWALCGKRTDNSEEQDRCQLVRITWHNEANPNYMWSSESQEKLSHVVNYGGTLSPAVRGHATRVTCHIITPNNEDLVIDADSAYPYLSLVPSETSTCRIDIGPIQESMLGDWTLYGKFRDFTGIHEQRLPMNLFLYDQDNPYDQAYNVTVNNPVQRAVILGTSLNIEVPGSGTVDSCEVMTPSGVTFDLNGPIYEGASFVNVEGAITCRIAIGPVTEQLLGSWTVIGKFSDGSRFTELQQTFEVLEEDPENPITDEERQIQNLPEQRVTTQFGTSQRLIIQSSIFITGESCHIRTPSGLQYAIIDGFNVDGVEILEENGLECGVTVGVLSEEAVGTWTLIARATQSSQLIERRLPFTIAVEETVEATPKEMTIVEGNDLYVRLAGTTEQYETCELVGPTGSVSPHVVDPSHVLSCGFLIRNITTADAGTWEISYGSRATYRARIVVSVTENSNGAGADFTPVINLTRDRSANETVGPENTVYCHLLDPHGITVFDGFGRCTLTLDKVVSRHHGAWRMVVAIAGRVIGVEHQLFVNVHEAVAKALVSTNVEQNKPIVTVTCSVATEATVRACKFRDPQGKLLLAAGGVAEDRYVFHGSETSYQSSVRTHECGLQITNPLVSDLGLWRCAIETDEDTYYGFLDVLCPWALQDPAVAAVVQQVPILRSEKDFVDGVQEEPVTMSCAVEAAIRYCYFRASNGTTFAVFPGMTSSNMEYVGAGFDAGDCGVKFSSMLHGDSGQWSCHVGLVRDPEEQRAAFALNIQETMQVKHYHNHNSVMIVEGIVYEMRDLEYCRYVRIDGYGFTTDNMPSGYANSGLLRHGQCQLTVVSPTILDMHPWTVAAKIRGQDVEISRDTMESILIGAPSTPVEHELGGVHGQKGLGIFLYVFMGVLLVSVLLGAWLGPKKNREWTTSRANTLRQSLQRSFRKEPLPPQAPINYSA